MEWYYHFPKFFFVTIFSSWDFISQALLQSTRFYSQPLATGDLFPDPIVWLFPGCYIHGIRWYGASWVWFLSCSKIYQDPFMLLCGSAVIPFLLLSSALLYGYTALHLFTSWGTLGLLPELSHCELSHYKHSHTIFFWCEHMSSVLLPRCGIAGLNDKCVFNFYKKLLNHFQSGCSILPSEKGLELRLHLYHLRSLQ